MSAAPSRATPKMIAIRIQPIEFLEDRRRNDQLPQIAAREFHVAHHRHHNLDRGDRQRHGEKERGRHSAVRLGPEFRREHEAERNAASEGNPGWPRESRLRAQRRAVVSPPQKGVEPRRYSFD